MKRSKQKGHMHAFNHYPKQWVTRDASKIALCLSRWGNPFLMQWKQINEIVTTSGGITYKKTTYHMSSTEGILKYLKLTEI